MYLRISFYVLYKVVIYLMLFKVLLGVRGFASRNLTICY